MHWDWDSWAKQQEKIEMELRPREQPGLLHSKKRTTWSGLMKTALNNVVLPTLFKVVNNTEQVDEPELACNQV